MKEYLEPYRIYSGYSLGQKIPLQTAGQTHLFVQLTKVLGQIWLPAIEISQLVF